MMRVFARIVVEGSGDCWTAWFQDVPQIATGGEWPSDAIRRLLEHYGGEHFDGEAIESIEEETREGHLEFRFPLKGRLKIPVPSVN